MQDKRKRVNIVSTGSKSVDGILGGIPFATTCSRQTFNENLQAA